MAQVAGKTVVAVVADRTVIDRMTLTSFAKITFCGHDDTILWGSLVVHPFISQNLGISQLN